MFSSIGNKFSNIKDDTNLLTGLDKLENFTNQTYKAAEGYVKTYEQSIKNLNNDASKDDIKKLILLIQKCNSGNTLSKNDGKQSIPNKSIKNVREGEVQIEEEKVSQNHNQKMANYFY